MSCDTKLCEYIMNLGLKLTFLAKQRHKKLISNAYRKSKTVQKQCLVYIIGKTNCCSFCNYVYLGLSAGIKKLTMFEAAFVILKSLFLFVCVNTRGEKCVETISSK